MSRTDGFVEYTLELLEPLGPVQARRMFGAWGVYLHGRMFGIVDEGQLYLKTDDVTREAFRAAGCKPFTFESRGKVMETGYLTPPPDVGDDARELMPWARRAVEASERAAARKAPRGRRASAVAKVPLAKKGSSAKRAARPKGRR